MLDYLLFGILGLGLAVSSGFRVFIPLLFLSVFNKLGLIVLNSKFDWLGSTPMLIVLIVATIIEILAYYIPYISNLLDVLEAPMAALAGGFLMFAVLPSDMGWLNWLLVIIAGGSALGVQGGTTLLRGVSTAVTGGVSNIFVNTIEIIISTFLSILTLLLPILSILFIFIIFIIFFKLNKKKRGLKNV